MNGETVEHELARLQKEWWYFLLLGILLVIGGTMAICYPFLASAGVAVLLGAILIVCGMATIISAFWAGRWSALMLQVLVGLLYTVAGFAMTDAPIEGAQILTFLLATFFVVVGGVRIAAALVDKFPQWGWALLNGVVTLLLGLIIFRNIREFPEASFWILGLLVGIELLFNGWTWIMLSISVKRLEPK